MDGSYWVIHTSVEGWGWAQGLWPRLQSKKDQRKNGTQWVISLMSWLFPLNVLLVSQMKTIALECHIRKYPLWWHSVWTEKWLLIRHITAKAHPVKRLVTRDVNVFGFSFWRWPYCSGDPLRQLKMTSGPKRKWPIENYGTDETSEIKDQTSKTSRIFCLESSNVARSDENVTSGLWFHTAPMCSRT